MPRGHFILPQVTHRARGAITLTYAKAFTSVLNGPTRVKLLDPISIKSIHVRHSLSRLSEAAKSTLSSARGARARRFRRASGRDPVGESWLRGDMRIHAGVNFNNKFTMTALNEELSLFWLPKSHRRPRL